MKADWRCEVYGSAAWRPREWRSTADHRFDFAVERGSARPSDDLDELHLSGRADGEADRAGALLAFPAGFGRILLALREMGGNAAKILGVRSRPAMADPAGRHGRRRLHLDRSIARFF